MGQRKVDREWPSPRNTRHVWVVGEDQLTPPVQGLVIAWARRSYRWSALVVRVDDSGGAGAGAGAGGAGRTVQDWLPVERLRPVRSDPNRVLKYAGFSELLRPSRSDS